MKRLISSFLLASLLVYGGSVVGWDTAQLFHKKLGNSTLVDTTRSNITFKVLKTQSGAQTALSANPYRLKSGNVVLEGDVRSASGTINTTVGISIYRPGVGSVLYPLETFTVADSFKYVLSDSSWIANDLPGQIILYITEAGNQSNVWEFDLRNYDPSE